MDSTPASKPKRLRLIIADDHGMIIDACQKMLEVDGHSIVGTAMKPGDVLPLYEKLKPDLVLLDINFGEQAKSAGLEVLKALRSADPNAGVVMMTQFQEPPFVTAAYSAGARGYFMKSQGADTLRSLVAECGEGRQVFPPEVGRALWGALEAQVRPSRAAALSEGAPGEGSPEAVVASFNAREQAIFVLMAQSRTIKEIALEQKCSEKTVALISASIKSRLGVERGWELSRLALRLGLIKLD